jgi:hypothetical protein
MGVFGFHVFPRNRRFDHLSLSPYGTWPIWGARRNRLRAIRWSLGKPGLARGFKAMEAIHAEMTFATLEQNPEFKGEGKKQSYNVLLRVRGPGSIIYNNLAGAWLHGICLPGRALTRSRQASYSRKLSTMGKPSKAS